MTYFDIHTHRMNPRAIYNTCKSPNEEMMCSVGIHPWFIKDVELQLDVLEEVLEEGTPLAVGECGLDKVCDTDWGLQVRVFRQQIVLATKYSKPIIVHCVRAYQECLLELRDFEGCILFHGFNKSKELLVQLIKRENVFISFGEKVFDPGFKSVIEACELSRVFLETDDADIHIEEVYTSFAETRSLSIPELKAQIELNRKQFFR